MSQIAHLLPMFLLSVAVGTFIPLVPAALMHRKRIHEIAIILVVLAIIGACAGLAGGMSRVGVVGSIIPAFLGLLGGFSIYLFGVDQTKGVIMSFGAAALSLALVVSYSTGAHTRNVSDDHRNIRSICAEAYTNWELLSNDLAFDRFRERLGKLCDKSMSWRITS